MRLKQIKLSGFKSFVDLTLVPFPQQMTAVVGPNGCGKSNVIDAVRWVLGESSAKNLRGDAMTDVIFNGSSGRKPVSQASVELVFENTQGRLLGQLADRSEIAIKRLVTRDAQSSYFLNGSKCRRRDITDIFLGTGLGPRSYAIIEQGMISRLIESKPQELRVFIEEAAGISKYKERRLETENRIKHTRENLDRLSDVRQELGKNIDKLKRQASTAERYKELKAQERKLKAELTTIKWLAFQQQLTALEQQLQQQETELEKYQASQLGDQSALLALKEQAVTIRQQLEQQQSRFYQLGTTITRLEQQILHQRQQQQNLQLQLQQKQQALKEVVAYVAEQQVEQDELTDVINNNQPELELINAQLDDIQQQLQQDEDAVSVQQQAWQQWQQQYFSLQQRQQQQQLQLQNLQQQYGRLTEQQQRLQREAAELEQTPFQQQIAELTASSLAIQQQQTTEQQQFTQQEQQLQQLQLDYEQLKQQQMQQQGVLHLLQQERQQLEKLQQQHNATQQASLLQQLDVEPDWALAVAVVLGQLQYARAQNAAVFADNLAAYVTVPSVEKQAGYLSSTILSGVFPDFFNTVLLADTLALAQQQVAELPAGYSVISKDGYWLGSNWGMAASAEQQDSYLLRQQRLQQIIRQQDQQQTQLVQLDTRVQQQQTLLTENRQQLSQQKAALNTILQQCQQAETRLLLAKQEWQQIQKQQLKLAAEQDQLELQLAQQSEQIEILQLQLEQTTENLLQHESGQQSITVSQQQLQQQLQAQKHLYESKRQQQQQLQTQLQVTQHQLNALQQNLQRAQQQATLLQQQIRETELQSADDDEPEMVLQEQLQEALLQRETAEQELLLQQDKLAGTEQQIRGLEQGQHSILQLVAQKQKQLENIRLDGEGYRIRANNMLELLSEQKVALKDVLAELSAEADETSWQQQLDKTTEAISRLGPINLAAIDEYAQQAERKQYLDSQHDDLTSALDTLETAIRKIDKETRQKFKETFEQVNDGLKGLFPKVFGGGSAYLDLTEDDLLETGVTIMARPPGKKNSTIHLLSGGEKALTALSLVFSIFRLNPAPFCMLDEVDAPLDDANVGRFCNLVREMSETVQFIYISHNKIAMEMAAQLMGVTMQEPGVSRVVAVDVEDAVKMAAAS